MSASAQAAGSPRRAALLVHAMPAPDQAWLLGSLPLDDRTELEGLLAELRELGIPPDEGLLRQVLDAPVAAVPAGRQSLLETLQPAQVDALAEALRGEPAQLVATLLAANAWPWKDVLLSQFAPDAQQRIAAARPLQGARVQQAVCAIALRQAKAGVRHVTPVQAPRPNPWRRLLPVRWKGRTA